MAEKMYVYIIIGISAALLCLIIIALVNLLKLKEKIREVEAQDKDVAEELGQMRRDNQMMVQTIQNSFQTFGQMVSTNQRQSAESQDKRLADLNSRFSHMAVENEQKLEYIRSTMEKQIGDLTADNNRQLEQMRQTVDEKLQKTLEDRISQSFKLVSERLEQVYKGLGEMQNLASGVGDLKKVLSNVKTRGILGEVQLGAILEQILSPQQYEKNVRTKSTGNERVEFAVKLPGGSRGVCDVSSGASHDGSSHGALSGASNYAESGGSSYPDSSSVMFDGTVWLPIDAKFPGDAYAKLVDAYETGEPQSIEEAAKNLERVIKLEAKDIRDKYLEPPYTTDFGIMFLPFEGLYAEVVRRGLLEVLQREYKVNIAGPTTMAALLNSLQMGFKTLAIQEHSSQVWEVLGSVKTEFDKFGEVLEATQNKINQANAELDKLIGVRTRSIQRKLRGVTALGIGETRPTDETARHADETAGSADETARPTDETARSADDTGEAPPVPPIRHNQGKGDQSAI